MIALFQATFGDPVLAYIGPGAGIAVLGSFLTILAGLLTAMAGILTWPITSAWRWFRGRKARAREKKKKVVILGLDGLDPDLVDRYLEEGILPNFAALRDEGIYCRLGTTWPPLSPVAWSSFSTGVNPGKHNIFDFVSRNPANYAPQISSVKIRPPKRHLTIGKFRIPLSSPKLESLRKSTPFWTILGKSGIFSSILRVPITFPTDRFYGVQLAAMCVPDLLGTQGTFFHFVERGDAEMEKTMEGEIRGERVFVKRVGAEIRGHLPGPANPFRTDDSPVSLAFVVKRARGKVFLHINSQKIRLPENEFTDWVSLDFRLAPTIKARAVCKFVLRQFDDDSFDLYCSPLNIDPAKPVMPISHPRNYSIYLAGEYGPYATLGLAEDTSSLSEGIITEEQFLEEAYRIHDERERMFFDSVQKVKRGLVACVFDASDRIQHMFWRFHDPDHPARGDDEEKAERNRDAIRDMYRRMDDLVGETRKRVGDDTALLVMSDHGFKAFRRGVDLNAWLLENGYLKLKADAPEGKDATTDNIDWEETKAYAFGLAGIFVNQKGREANGVVASGEEREQLVREICEGLTGLCDPKSGDIAVERAVVREDVFTGPYIGTSPDVILGFRPGYHISWGTALGHTGRAVFMDNHQAWSGDHCLDPDLVPGILFSNMALNPDGARLVDIGPTALDILGVETPGYMDGNSILASGPPDTGTDHSPLAAVDAGSPASLSR